MEIKAMGTTDRVVFYACGVSIAVILISAVVIAFDAGLL